MEYQKIANLIYDASNQPSKFRTKNLVEINDESTGTCHVNSQIKFKTTMLKSSLCDDGDAYILVKGKITITGAGADVAARQAHERDKSVAFKNCAPLYFSIYFCSFNWHKYLSKPEFIKKKSKSKSFS